MDGFGFTVRVVFPLLMLAIKVGIMWSTWNLIRALTRYINVRMRNEATHPRQ